MRQGAIIVCARLGLCVGLMSLCALARAGNDVIGDYLAEERQAMGLSPLPRVDVPAYLSAEPPPMAMRPYVSPPEEPQRSLRPPWLQPADQFSGWSSLSPAEKQRLFCVAPNDCWLDPR